MLLFRFKLSMMETIKNSKDRFLTAGFPEITDFQTKTTDLFSKKRKEKLVFIDCKAPATFRGEHFVLQLRTFGSRTINIKI